MCSHQCLHNKLVRFVFIGGRVDDVTNTQRLVLAHWWKEATITWSKNLNFLQRVKKFVFTLTGNVVPTFGPKGCDLIATVNRPRGCCMGD